MSKQDISRSQKGFTLLEILAVMVIMGIMAFIAINLYNSVMARDQHRETRQRIDFIAAKIKQHYQIHERLPEPENNNKLPARALGLEQKYRLDAWGQYLEYHLATVDNACDTFQVNGQMAHGVLISLGHNQRRDYDQNGCEFSTGGDDGLQGFDLTEEKIHITRQKLKVLQEKVAAYDALFAGVDNDGDGIVDNVSDVGSPAVIDPVVPNICPPTHSFENDPSEGRTTLSEIERRWDGDLNTEDYGCTILPVVFHVVKFYGLPGGRSGSSDEPDDSDECDPEIHGGYDCDPWNRPFKWGYENRERDDGDLIEKPDPRYHRFYSSGPIDTIIEDDIVFTGP